MKEVAAKMQDKGGLKTCHVSITMVNNVCDCGKIIEHLHHHTDIEIDSELETITLWKIYLHTSTGCMKKRS